MKRPAAILPLLAAAVVMASCGPKDEEARQPREVEGSKTGERPAPTRTERPAHPEPAARPDPAPPAEEGPDPAELMAQLTPENALEIREKLRSEARLWKSTAGPFYRQWASLDPQAAMAAAQSEDPKMGLISTSMALAGWTMNDPGGARDWFDANMNEPYQLRFAHSLVSYWPKDDFEGLATWTERFPAGKEKTNLVTRMAGTWRRHQPDGAAQWVATLPAGEARDRATDFVFQSWGKEDPTAAGEFLAANIEADNIDVAISSYAKAVVPDDPDAAVLWAEEIADSRLRDEILEAIPLIRGNPGGSPVNFPGP
ncbi:MAG: hypothetical protein HKN82_19385 [Akkermansiaceae bacterium]|nr:hypothetical protein [Akkermansiaceae bacterium]NNM30131.1 hypothetical protein [Akkermansiaceae bacterium]